MKKALISRLLDYIPLLILVGLAIDLVVAIFITNISVQSVQYVGLGLLLTTIVVFFLNHKLGVICLGITILAGLVGFASISRAISWSTIYLGILKISFGPEFLALAILHGILSGRHYIGILTADYWDEIFDKGSNAPQKIDD